MISLGEFSGSELANVSTLAMQLLPSERRGEGIQVECVDGRRVWSCATKHGAFRCIGDAASFAGRHLLHLRFIRHAEALVDIHAQATIAIHDGQAKVSSAEASGSMPLALIGPDTALLDIHTPTTAEISLAGLRHILWGGSHEPCEHFVDTEANRIGVVTTVTFGPHEVGITTDFAELGCPHGSASWSATVKGPAGSISIQRSDLQRLLSVLHFCSDSTVRMAADADRGGVLVVEGDDWRVALPEAPTRAGRHYRELYDKLDIADLLTAEHEDGRLAATVDGVEMVLQLLDGRWPIVRCTVHVVGDVERTPELLDEIDQQNEGRAFTKYFMSGNAVYAGIDVRCSDIDTIDEYLRVLADDSRLLGTYLAALGAKNSTPTLW